MSERNQLYFGDNLRVLRDSITDASVDLIYLDPPFNSKRDYNLLFKTPKPPKALKTGKGAGGAVTAEEPEADTATAKRRSRPSRIPGIGAGRPKTSSGKSCTTPTPTSPS